MPAPKLQYLNQKLSEYLDDKVSNYSQDGAIYSSVKRDEYLNRAMNYLFRFTWNIVQNSPFGRFELFTRLLPDLVKRVDNKTSSSVAPAKFVLDSTTSDLFQIISIYRNSDKKIFTPIPTENILIAESGFNSLYNFTENNPAFSLLGNTIYFLPSNLTNMQFNMLYIKSPVQDDGSIYSSNGNYDIPFKPEFYEVILQTAKAFALFDSHEIDYGQLIMQLSLTETSILKGGR